MRRILQKNRQSLFSMIPSEIIEDMDLKAGDKLDFCIDKGLIIAIPVHANRQVKNVQAAAHEPIKAEGCT